MSTSSEHALGELPPATLDGAVAALRLLADPTRLSILWQLRDDEAAVGELSRDLERPSPAISQHLAKLRLGGLVSTRRDGTQIFYRLRTAHVRQLVLDVLAHAEHLEAER